jgi:surfeit locus 1 family protein
MRIGSRSLLLIISLLVAAGCIRLGIWQLSRLRERRATNTAAALARGGAVLNLNQPSPAGMDRRNRRVTARGTYDRAYEVVLRGHVHREVPGVHVVTPLRLEGQDSAVLVNRGFLPSPDAMYAVTDSLNEPGPVTVVGLALPVPESADSGAPVMNNGRETWRRLDLAALRKRSPYPLLDVYVLQSPDASLPPAPRRLEPQPLDDGPHLSYAIQWFSFATIAVVGTTVFLARQRR